MKFKAFCQYLIILHYVALISCESYYTVIAPGVMKSNRKYTAAVTLHNANTNCTMRVSVLGHSYNITDEVQLQPFQTKNIEFYPPKLEKGNYKLLTEGVRGCVFRNESELSIATDAGPKIYIQTDKSIYKPLDLVQFRVVILDEHTRPMDIREPIRIEIFDYYRNRVKQFKDITLTKGVFTGKFHISQQPIMGKWEIKVTISGKYNHQNSKEIQVQLYNLPKFSLHVKAPKYFIHEEPYFRSEVYGKYTFDKYVEGTLYIELKGMFNDVIIERQTLHTEGLTFVEFHVKDLEKLNGAYYLLYRVKLEEKHTGAAAYFSHQTTISEKPYVIKVPEDEIEFRYNKPFRFHVHIEHLNNGPIYDVTTPVIMEHGSRKYESYMNKQGVALIEFEQNPNAHYLFKYKNSLQSMPNVNLAQNNNDEENVYCKLTLKEKPHLGKPVEVQIRSSFNLQYFVYIVISHGNIINMGNIKVPANRKTYTLNLTPSIEMIPTSFLYVHYVLNGNLRYEELTIQFPKEFENKISISAPKQVKPGQEVTLNLIAQPKSYVSILAVDLSVYLLDNKYDLNKDDVLRDLALDKSYVPNANIVRPGVISGLITLTNANYPVSSQYGGGIYSATEKPMEFRTNFPETWIFENYIINNTDTKIVLNMSDTITTWRITAFSNNYLTGIGMLDGPTDITTFLPFFLTLNLPHNVKRDEIIIIPVTVFNYHNQSLDTDITMYNKDLNFHFVEPMSKHHNSHQLTKHMTIPSVGGKTVKFSIKSSQIGELEIRITANNSLYSDGVIKKLKVIPEGITKYQNKAIYLSATAGNSFLQLDIPVDSVKDSEEITLSVGGDYMIPVLENLNDLVKMPTGCGEQNMVNFAPNVLILDYMKATGKYLKSPKLVSRAKYFIDIGYQQALSYRHHNGGYSVFGETYDKETSTWLTAYIARFLIKASIYSPIETRIIDTALEYLANQQLADGSFPYTGYLFFKQLQNKYGFTAFVLLTFMEDRKYIRKYQKNILSAINYISIDPQEISDTYALSIMARALSKFKHPAADKVIEKLQSLRHENERGLVWWSSNGTDIETTAYTLMSLLNRPGGNYLPILKWLIQQRNEKGGFRTTHDTVVGLEALVQFSQLYNSGNSWNMKVTYSAEDFGGNIKKVNEFLINRENALTLQEHELPKSTRKVHFNIVGNGYTLVQLSAQYNVKSDNKNKYFSINIKTFNINDEEMDLDICFSYYAPQKDISSSSNMVIMEANLLTGYKALSEFNQRLLEFEFVQRIETKNEDTTMILYFDKLTSQQGYCVNILTFKSNEVEDRKPAAIIMYDYYDTSRINSEFYNEGN